MAGMREPIEGLLSPLAADSLADRLGQLDYTVDGVANALGPSVGAAFGRGDLTAVERSTREVGGLNSVIRLFLLGLDVPSNQLVSALGRSSLEDLRAAGIVRPTDATGSAAGSDRANVDIRPYTETTASPLEPSNGPSWLVVSDFGADIRPGPLDPGHVLGIGAAASTLAQAVVREPVARALDLGTGCGVQALHLARHSDRVVATDISSRALRFAATTAALNAESWDLRQGDLTQPVAGEQFDLIVANPPFVVGPAQGAFDYRDSGWAGDGVSAELVRTLPGLLAEGGTAQFLANWVITDDEPWNERLSGWLTGRGCDAWIWQREVADPSEYVAMWLRDGGLRPTDASYPGAYDAWLEWFRVEGVLAVGMGLVNLRRTGSSSGPAVTCEDVPQALEPPIAPSILSWWQRLDWLRERDDSAFLASRLDPAPDLVLTTHAVLLAQGWRTDAYRLRNAGGMHWEVDTDPAISAVVAGIGAGSTPGAALALWADALGRPTADVVGAAMPVLRDLVQRGLLRPHPPIGAL